MARSGMNMERVKIQNRSLILRYINGHGPVSRKEISKATGLTAASVTQITMQLLAEGMLRELGAAAESSGKAGRKEVMIDIRSEAMLVLSFNIEPEETTAAICDLKGNLIRNDAKEELIIRFKTERDIPAKEFLLRSANRLKRLFFALPEDLRDRVKGLAVGVTGIVDIENGISQHAYGIWDEPVDIRGILEPELRLPVTVENNVDAFAIAELLFGAGRTHDDFLLIKWGPGVGSAIVVNDAVYRGRHGKTAEMGHFIVEKNGKKGSCGRRGCLETKVSYKALHEILPFTPETFSDAYLSAGSEERKALDQAIELFARCIVNAGALIAPKRIVLCGPLFDNTVIRMKLTACCEAFDPAYNSRRIVHTALEGKESYIGPAAVYIQKIYTGS